MTTAQYPRSPKEEVNGLCHLGRLIDKIRMRNAGSCCRIAQWMKKSDSKEDMPSGI